MLDILKKKFSIGGYNFDDWSLVKELYVPGDISGSTELTLHLRGREDFPDHLQHYIIPNDKVFIVFAITNVEITATSGIGLFGTGKRYGRYPVSCQQPGWGDNPGAPIAWRNDSYKHYGDDTEKWYYYEPAYGTLVLHNDRVYECAQTHWPDPEDPTKEPHPDHHTAWWLRGSTWDINWKDNTFYFFNEIELVEVEGFVGSYFCMVDHTSSSTTKPCSGADWDYSKPGGIWNPGDEYKSDLEFGFSAKCLNVSKGTDNPFSGEILAVFDGTTFIYGRWIDAMVSDGTMKAGAVLWGVEVDE